MIFQDPFASLNPRRSVGSIIAAGPIAQGVAEDAAALLAHEWLERVDLPASAFDRFPHQFSGGQRQRISIARALALRPRVLIADEAVSGLDVSIQEKILALLDSVRESLNLALIFITHDLRVAAQISDRIMVMQGGRVVEAGSADQIIHAPAHPYTQLLIDSMPGHARRLLFNPAAVTHRPSNVFPFVAPQHETTPDTGSSA
jgi:peptide/nickel transport system ATP-binding protein